MSHDANPIGGLTLLKVNIVGLALSSLSVVATCLRLWDRTRSRRLWWDDAAALVGLCFLVGLMGLLTAYIHSPEDRPPATKAAIYLSGTTAFYSAIWSSRISILFTIIRLQYGQTLRVLWVLAALFGAAWAVLVAQIFWICEGDPPWKLSENPSCYLGLQAALTQLISYIFSDAVLIAAPIWIVYRSSGLTRFQKTQLISLFSTTIILTIISISHAYVVLKFGGLRQVLLGAIEGPVSVFVANLSVLVAILFRLSGPPSDSEERHTSDSEEHHTSNPAFTTVYLDSIISNSTISNGPTRFFRSVPTFFLHRVQVEHTSTFMAADGRVRVRNGPKVSERGASEPELCS